MGYLLLISFLAFTLHISSVLAQRCFRTSFELPIYSITLLLRSILLSHCSEMEYVPPSLVLHVFGRSSSPHFQYAWLYTALALQALCFSF